jgi:hypothetical protein
MSALDRSYDLAEISSENDSWSLVSDSGHKAIDSEFLDAICNGIVIIGKDFQITSQNYISRAYMGNLVGQPCYKVLENRSAPCENCPRTAMSNGEYETSIRCAGKEYSMYEVRIYQSGKDFEIVEVYPNMIDREILARNLHHYREEINILKSVVERINNATADDII